LLEESKFFCWDSGNDFIAAVSGVVAVDKAPATESFTDSILLWRSSLSVFISLRILAASVAMRACASISGCACAFDFRASNTAAWRSDFSHIH